MILCLLTDELEMPTVIIDKYVNGTPTTRLNTNKDEGLYIFMFYLTILLTSPITTYVPVTRVSNRFLNTIKRKNWSTIWSVFVLNIFFLLLLLLCSTWSVGPYIKLYLELDYQVWRKCNLSWNRRKLKLVLSVQYYWHQWFCRDGDRWTSKYNKELVVTCMM